MWNIGKLARSPGLSRIVHSVTAQPRSQPLCLSLGGLLYTTPLVTIHLDAPARLKSDMETSNAGVSLPITLDANRWERRGNVGGLGTTHGIGSDATDVLSPYPLYRLAPPPFDRFPSSLKGFPDTFPVGGNPQTLLLTFYHTHVRIR